MYTRVVYLMILVIGIGIGISVTYFQFHSNSMKYLDNNQLLERVFVYSNTLISDDNYACEGKRANTVGSVIASLLALNEINKVNMLTYGCFSDTCSVSVSSCQPWQDQECSTRYLKFNLDNDNKIKPNTFSCLDMP